MNETVATRPAGQDPGICSVKPSPLAIRLWRARCELAHARCLALGRSIAARDLCHQGKGTSVRHVDLVTGA